MSLFQRLDEIKNRTAAPERPAPAGEPAAPFRETWVPPGGREENSPFGKYILLEDSEPGGFPFPGGGREAVLADLKLVRGVGPVNEARLRKLGFSSVCDLTDHPRWGDCARRVMELADGCDVRGLRGLGAGDWDLLSYFGPEDVVFLDIETTGLWASQPLFLIGLLFKSGDGMAVRQFFARHYREEKAVLAAANEVIQRFKVIVSYNGKRFDIQYIYGRSVAHRLFYSYPHHHVDLLYHARRKFGGVLPDCRLATLEERLLNFRREGDIPGHLIPQTYHRYVRQRDPEIIRPVIEHNRLDLLAMARLFGIAGHGGPGIGEKRSVK
ncbi:MAG: ribonuclease H-like domain-containing protein [Peptococcaceae bacterium]|nr:ribonuclease H-like domain-containing protein [Peptococcaceae bacterium]